MPLVLERLDILANVAFVDNVNIKTIVATIVFMVLSNVLSTHVLIDHFFML